MVASNLQRLADDVPDEGWHEHLLDHTGCSCNTEKDDPWAKEASAEVSDDDFQVAPPVPGPKDLPIEDNLPPSYHLALLQRANSDGHLVAHSSHRSGCNCASKALSLAKSSTAVSAGSADADAKPTGIWLHTCHYAQRDLQFWRLTNTAYLRGGIILKETIAYTDSCDMCEYNNVACEKDEVELTDGNCLCMWRMNGAEMVTELLSCSACVTDCLGSYRTFDLGKPEPGFQKGICLRKKPHMQLDDLENPAR
jgi:uncharacterized protein GlcG (DUF336 family)